MARMKGQRLTLLQPKNVLLRLNEAQAQNIVEGLVENRKTIRETDIDLYDSLTMDTLEQLEQFGMHYPDLVLGEDQPFTPEEIDAVKDELRLIGNKFVQLHDLMKNQPTMNRQKLQIVRTGMAELHNAMTLLFGSEQADVLTNRSGS